MYVAPTPKKQVKKVAVKPSSPPVKKERLSQAEAETRMMNATVELILTVPPADITVHMICNRAGVHHDYVARYFGSQDELLIRTSEQALLGLVARERMSKYDTLLESSRTVQGDIFEMAGARYRLITYLLAKGVDPSRFQANQKVIVDLGTSVFINPQLSERSKRNFALIMLMILQSMHVLGDINELSPQDKEDILSFIALSGLFTEHIQDVLGWDKPPAKTKKK